MGTRWTVVLLAFLAACRAPSPRPVEIEASDMCSRCRMAISQKRFAAQMVLEDGSAVKFDDIGCLLKYRKEASHREGVAAIYVADYQTKEWVEASRASLLRTTKVPTPMAGGILAYGDRTRAEAGSREFEGSVSTFSGLSAP